MPSVVVIGNVILRGAEFFLLFCLVWLGVHGNVEERRFPCMVTLYREVILPLECIVERL